LSLFLSPSEREFMVLRKGILSYFLISMVVSGSPVDNIARCPGEGPRYGDRKCNHDATHRVCAKLLESHGDRRPMKWGSQDFWEITGQKAFQWDGEIRKTPGGDSWCICMWAFARMIEKVGCENVHIRCDATDVRYLLSKYQDGSHDLTQAHQCVRQKCLPEFPEL